MQARLLRALALIVMPMHVGCVGADRSAPTLLPADQRWQLDPAMPDGAPAGAGCPETDARAPCIEDDAFAVLRGTDPKTSGGEHSAPRASGPRRLTDQRWWESFGDAQLNRLIERARRSSYDTRAAWARVAVAERLADQQRASRWPMLDAQLNAQRTRQVANFPSAFGQAVGGPDGGGAGSIPSTFETEAYTATLEAGWQPPLWGRVESAVEAAKADVRAARVDVADVRLALAGQVASAYFDLLEARSRRALLGRQLEASRARLELIRTLFEQGLVNASALQQERRSVASTLSRLAELVGSERGSRARLALLAGTAPSELPPIRDGRQLPRLPSLHGRSVPAEVVQRRPDVQAARARLQASEQNVSAAIAERLPALRLQGSVGFGGTEVQETFDNVIWSAVATVTQPLWRGGQIGAQLGRAQAEREQRIANYANTVLGALSEVESALANARRAHARVETLEEEVEAAAAALAQTELEYQNGLVDFLSVLDAERSLHTAQLALLSARRQGISARVSLQQALGSGTSARSTASRSGVAR